MAGSLYLDQLMYISPRLSSCRSKHPSVPFYSPLSLLVLLPISGLASPEFRYSLYSESTLPQSLTASLGKVIIYSTCQIGLTSSTMALSLEI